MREYPARTTSGDEIRLGTGRSADLHPHVRPDGRGVEIVGSLDHDLPGVEIEGDGAARTGAPEADHRVGRRLEPARLAGVQARYPAIPLGLAHALAQVADEELTGRGVAVVDRDRRPAGGRRGGADHGFADELVGDGG